MVGQSVGFGTAVLALIWMAIWAPAAQAELRLPSIITNHMVLQQKKPVRLWGWADPGEKVIVQLGGKQKQDTASKDDGLWSVKLPKMKAGGPFQIKINTESGERITVRDVMVGEVWVCGGQSNMEWSVSHGIDNGERHAAMADHPTIRLFDIPHATADQPLDDVESAWRVCTPETMKTFSAIGYFFGRKIQQDLNVPIGLISANWGGTEAEPWTSREALEDERDLKSLLEQWDSDIARDPELKLNLRRPAVLYNGMIAPIIRYPVKGVIWYQGESNVTRPEDYRVVFPTLIKSWRNAWRSNLPFYYVQIAPFRYSTLFKQWGVSPTALPVLWDSQREVLDRVDHVGMVTISDVGDVNEIHPPNKLVVGERLAAFALDDTYGKTGTVVSGPIFDGKHHRWGGKVEIEFFYEGAGLTTRDGKAPTHFEIAGKDRVFHPATAEIKSKDSVLVWSEKVRKPKAVRFAWREDAQPNLMNKEGLPASPFRTDDWPVDTHAR